MSVRVRVGTEEPGLHLLEASSQMNGLGLDSGSVFGFSGREDEAFELGLRLPLWLGSTLGLRAIMNRTERGAHRKAHDA